LSENITEDSELTPRQIKKEVKRLFKDALKIYKLGDLEEAIKLFDDALELDPNNYEVLNQKGVLLDKLDNTEEAIKIYDKAIEIEPEQTKAYYNKGLLLKDLKKYDEALEIFDKVTEIDIMHLSSHFEKGLIHDELGHLEEAIKYYEAIVEVKPRANLVRYYLNIALEKKAETTNVWKSRLQTE